MREQGPEASTALPVRAPVTAPPLPARGAHDPQLHDELVGDAIERFAQNKTAEANAATIAKYVAQCRLFLRIVSVDKENMMLSELLPKQMHNYVDALHRLPKKISPNDGRPIQDILADPLSKTVSATTKSHHAGAVKMFLHWCQDQQYSVQPNIEKTLNQFLKKTSANDKRKHFTREELKTVFESEEFQRGSSSEEPQRRSPNRISNYWVPLLGLFTGAREAELCQLTTDDIGFDRATGISFININAAGDKRLKNTPSRRQVPVHDDLIELGFLDFVKSALGNEGGRLFPNERRNNRGEFSAFSKRFNRRLKRIGLKGDPDTDLNFHSLRHTLQNNLVDQGHEEYIINDIVGHSQAKRSESVKTYSTGSGLKARHDVLHKLNYALDLG